MIDNHNIETYLYISPKYFGIYLFDTVKLNNLYHKEMKFEKIFQATEDKPKFSLWLIFLKTCLCLLRIKALEQKEIKPLLHLHKLKPE